MCDLRTLSVSLGGNSARERSSFGGPNIVYLSVDVELPSIFLTSSLRSCLNCVNPRLDRQSSVELNKARRVGRKMRKL